MFENRMNVVYFARKVQHVLVFPERAVQLVTKSVDKLLVEVLATESGHMSQLEKLDDILELS